MDMTQQAINTVEKTAIQASVIAPAVLALLLGAFLVLGTGFAHSDTIHNAAHDTRHSFAFPCH
jgi:cobalt transporter subunit CbtB